MLEIKKSKAFGTIEVPPSKSYAHRLLIAAALSNKPCKLQNIELNNDVRSTIKCLEAMGKKITINQSDVTIETKIKYADLPEKLEFECFESGSTLRFMIPIALTLNRLLVFKGTEKLISRGISVYEEICKSQQIEVIKEKDQIILNGVLKPDTFNIPGNISSQFISGLLFALPLLNEDSYINITTDLESANYIDMTLDVLQDAGIEVVNFDNRFIVKGSQEYKEINQKVEGDYSNAAFLDAFNYLDGNVNLTGLKENSMQGDKVYKKFFNLLSKGFAEIDLGPILFTFACIFHGGHFINTNRLTIKESNRIKDLEEELNKFGITLELPDNEVIIKKQEIKAPTEVLDGYNDHRIIMALSVLLSITGGKIKGEDAVTKSYPNFFNDLKELGIEVIKC